MSLRGRMERLQRHKSANGLPCPGCGWAGPILMVNETVNAAGVAVRWEDADGNPPPGFPDVPACDLCNHKSSPLCCRPFAATPRP